MERGEWSVHSFTPVLIARIVAGSAYFWASFINFGVLHDSILLPQQFL